MVVGADFEMVRWVAEHARAIDREEIERTLGLYDPDAIAEAATTMGSAWGFIDKGTPICVAGTMPARPGVIAAWCFGTRQMYARIRAITRAVNAVLDAEFEAGAHRCEVASWTGHHQAHGWLRGLGFHCEGLMRAYGARGDNFLLYARTE